MERAAPPLEAVRAIGRLEADGPWIGFGYRAGAPHIVVASMPGPVTQSSGGHAGTGASSGGSRRIGAGFRALHLLAAARIRHLIGDRAAARTLCDGANLDDRRGGRGRLPGGRMRSVQPPPAPATATDLCSPRRAHRIVSSVFSSCLRRDCRGRNPTTRRDRDTVKSHVRNLYSKLGAGTRRKPSGAPVSEAWFDRRRRTHTGRLASTARYRASRRRRANRPDRVKRVPAPRTD